MTLDEEINGIEAPDNQGVGGQDPVVVAPTESEPVAPVFFSTIYSCSCPPQHGAPHVPHSFMTKRNFS